MTSHIRRQPQRQLHSVEAAHYRRSGAALRATGEAVIGALLALDGIGVLGLWTLSLTSGAFGGMAGLFVYQDGNFPIFHVTAELLMGIVAVASGIGLLGRQPQPWAQGLALVTFGMLGYSAINSAGWPIRNDASLLVPMVATVMLVVISIPVILRGLAARRSDL
jgi:hypothetical protein